MRLNPMAFALEIIVKGVVVGVVLSIASPVASLINTTVISGYGKVKDALRKESKVVIDGENI